MSADLDDFERELMQYSELGPIPEILAPPPITIQRYQQIIRENNAASIFDADYSCPETTAYTATSPATSEDEENNPEAILYRNEQHVTRVTSGRGRGGRNIFHPPGHQVGLSEDDLELIRDIRKVAPLGYANEITENAIRAHQRAKRLERAMEEIKIAENSGKAQPDVKSDTESVANTSASSPSRKEIDEFEDCIKQETPSPSKPGLKTESQHVSVDERAPVPISTLLKQCRERHKQKQHRLVRENEASSGKDEAALCNSVPAGSQKTPKKKSSNRPDGENSKYENLPWRQRTNSPPRFPWSGKNSNCQRLSLKSLQDFPPLP
ncbi:hypothetical protein HUJ04_008022 [Dendroctonus ponderosae]